MHGGRGVIASTSDDKLLVVFDEDGKKICEYRHPAAAYGVQWCFCPPDTSGRAMTPTPHPMTLATGCMDGVVRVLRFRTERRGEDAAGRLAYDLTHAFHGHHGRKVFNVEWSRLLKGFIASGGDDHTVHVWHADDGGGDGGGYGDGGARAGVDG